MLASQQLNTLFFLSKTNGTTDPEGGARPKPKPSGPTDKQIESRTTDGRRRITPIFIPPDAEESRDDDTSAIKSDFSLKSYEKSTLCPS